MELAVSNTKAMEAGVRERHGGDSATETNGSRFRVGGTEKLEMGLRCGKTLCK